ncbi:MAG: HAMP domain-containing histidine kinase [Lachnospiraceae bacterium]|nr:HAMP domain-containing histidine kinase [Lachnospiraceae bacterium]
MKYVLIVSLIVNVLLIVKIIAMRYSVRSLQTEFSERISLDTNMLLGTESRDRLIRSLASSINETITNLRASYHKYRMGDAELKTAITNVTHDLRTPLTAICGYVELALNTDGEKEKERYLKIVSERANYMKKLTEELFEYSVITGGEITEEKENININRMLEDSVMNLYPAFEARGITPEVDICEKEILRELYPSYVERIFSNLLSNALKYSDGDLKVSLDEKGKVSIINSASALTPVTVEKLFDRFFTVETARNDQSHGLGLSIVKTFAERMNCPLTAKYEDGKLIIEIVF